MKLALAGCTSVVVAALLSGAAPRPARDPAPAALTVVERGRCLVVARDDASPDSVREEALCAPTANRPALDWARYTGLPQLLGVAADDAERAACGRPGCAFHDRRIRFYVVSDDLSTVGAWSDDQGTGFVLTTRAVDAIEGAVTAAGEGKLAAWLRAVDRHSGRSCEHEPAPGTLPGRQATISFWETLVAGQIARLRTGEECGEGVQSDQSSRDAACQRTACEYVGCGARVPVTPLAAGALALAHVESLERYARIRSGDEESLEMGARVRPPEWSQRAVVATHSFDASSDLRAALELPRPAACGVPQLEQRSPGPPIADLPAARACLHADARPGIEWDSDGDPVIAHVRLTLWNSCDHAIRCQIETVAAGGASGERRLPNRFTLSAQGTTRIDRLVLSPGPGTPFVRVFDRENRDLAQCEPM